MREYRFTAKALWAMFHHVKSHLRALRDTNASLEFFLENDKELILLLDFADLFQYIFDSRDLDDVLMPEAGKRYLLDSFFQSAPGNGIQLAMTPGARLELFECLQHTAKRTSQAISGLFPAQILNASLEEITSYLEKEGHKEADVINRLNPLVNDKHIDKCVRTPVKKVVNLYNSGLLVNVESAVSKDVQRLAQQVKGNHEIERALKNYFDQSRRKNSDGNPSHDQFHDMIDICNIRLAHDLVISCGKNVYTPFSTMSHRTVSAGRAVFASSGLKYPVVQPSLAPLLLFNMAQQYGRQNVSRHIKRALATAESLYSDLNSLGVIRDMRNPGSNRQEFIKNNPEPVNKLSNSTVALWAGFVEEMYPHLENGELTGNPTPDNVAEPISDLHDLITKIGTARRAPIDALSPDISYSRHRGGIFPAATSLS